jgi:hypothetical protein
LEEESMEAISKICDMAMVALARAINAASPDSPMAKARKELGDRFAEEVAAALRATLKRVLTDPATRSMVKGAPSGLPVGAAIMATVVADSCALVIAAAQRFAVH